MEWLGFTMARIDGKVGIYSEVAKGGDLVNIPC